jgi:dephospho-CoA kinase
MRLYGLTGGIASGKSTVSAMFRGLGAEVIDADVVAREVVALGTPGLEEISLRFPGVLAADGTLDRAKLGARVFRDPSERAALNALLHPRIQAAAAAKTAALARQGLRLALYDAALLFENGLEANLDGVVLVAVPREVQLERLMARDTLSLADAEARVGSQLPLEEKKKRATWVIDNTGSLDTTRAQVEAIWRVLSTTA